MIYRTFNDEMKERFGGKVYRLALDGGFTCPNRDGKVGTGGCIFCRGGSGAFAEGNADGVTAQIERAKERIKGKYNGGKYVAYFQSYTNTYGPVEKLRALFTEAINHPDIAALSVATRPDCLPQETVELLKELNNVKPVIVELGLQTVKKESVEYIRRGYGNEVFDDAMKRLKAAGIERVVHMIAGLPGESAEDIVRTADYIGKSGAEGIKIQLLHVLRGTDLEKDYRDGKFVTLTLPEYAEIVVQCLKVLPKDIVVHRITGDGAKRELVPPLWSADKQTVMNYLKKRIEEED